MLSLFIGHNLQIVGGEPRGWEGGSSKKDRKKSSKKSLKISSKKGSTKRFNWLYCGTLHNCGSTKKVRKKSSKKSSKKITNCWRGGEGGREEGREGGRVENCHSNAWGHQLRWKPQAKMHYNKRHYVLENITN
jgi:hypothetical protein